MTLRYVYGQDETVRFVAQQIPHVDRGFPADRLSIGIIDASGRMVAGIVYYFWNKKNGTIEIAAAALPGVRWFTRETIRRALDFAFMQCRCQLVIMRVRGQDERLLYQLARFGCTFIALPRLYGRDADGVMCLLTDDAWAAHPAAAPKIREAA